MAEKVEKTENKEISDALNNLNFQFKTYTEKKERAVEIFKELVKKFTPPRGGKTTADGFFMSEANRDYGILPQCQSMQALVSLASDYGLDFDTVYDAKFGLTIRQVMDYVIEDIIARVIKTDPETNEKCCVFDASPYTSGTQFTKEYSNIDAITWVVPSLFLILKYHASINEVCRFEDDLIFIVKNGLQYLNDAFINDESETEKDKLTIGWNFTKDCEEPSLYFTFEVCECYIDMYNTFARVLKYADAKRTSEEISADVLDDYNKAKENFSANKNKKVTADEFGRLHAKYDEYTELVRIFNLINSREEFTDDDEYPDIVIKGSLYGELEAKCKRISNNVWRLVNKDLADKFFYNDLRTTLTEEDLRISTTSDALFNTVYIINIMVDAGLDEDLLKLKKEAELAEDRAGADRYAREYEYFLESCQLAVQKALRTYDSLKNDSKEYIVDQFLIGFNENFGNSKEVIGMVSELRKLRMRSFSLVPLLIHTYNVISEYLIQYPQRVMDKYYNYILDNRYVDKNENVHWIWERDGFFSGSNYYYILALSEFYSYYEKYEKPLIDIGKDNVKRIQSIKEEYHKELSDENGDIGKLNKQLKEKNDEIDRKNEEIARLEKEMGEITRPVEDAVRDVISDELNKQFMPLLIETISGTAKVLTTPEADDSKDSDEYSRKLKEALFDMVMTALMSNYCFKRGRKRKTADEYNKLKSDLRKDLAAFFDEQISTLENSDKRHETNLRRVFQLDFEKMPKTP